MPRNDHGAGHTWSYESNIPILKRNYRFETCKKTKGKEFPEIQKYIESIIKARSEPLENDEINASETRVFETKCSCVDRDRLIKTDVEEDRGRPETVSKFVGRSKLKHKEKLNTNSFTSVENIKKDKEVKTLSATCINLKLENFLKKLYPNPCYLDEVKDFQNLKLKIGTWKCPVEKSKLDEIKTDIHDSSDMIILHKAESLAARTVVEGPKENYNFEGGIGDEGKDMNEALLTSCSSAEMRPNTRWEKAQDESINKNYLRTCFRDEGSGEYQNYGESNKPTDVCEKDFIFFDQFTNFNASNEPEVVEFKKSIKKSLKLSNDFGCSVPQQVSAAEQPFKPSDAVKKRKKPAVDALASKKPSTEFDLKRLKILTADKRTEEETEESKKKEKTIVNRSREKAKRKEAVGKVEGMIEMSQNLKLTDVGIRSNKHKSKVEVKKLFDIVDKTTRRLQEIRVRNEEELEAKKKIERINKQKAINYKFENNKFVQFIRKMHSDEKGEGALETSEAPGKNVSQKKKNENSGSIEKSNNLIKIKKNKLCKKLNSEKNSEKNGLTEINESSLAAVDSADDPSKKPEKYITNCGGDRKMGCRATRRSNDFNEEIYKLSEEILNEEINQIQRLKSVESNEKIDEMLECVQQFIEKLDGKYDSTKCKLKEIDGESSAPLSRFKEPQEGGKEVVGVENDGESFDATSDEWNHFEKGKTHRKRRQSSSRLIRVRESLPSTLDDRFIAENRDLNVEEANRVSIAEGTNELGGYNEEKPTERTSTDVEVQSTKNLLPVSVRIKKKQNDSSEALKKALEKEENFLLNRFLDVCRPSSAINPLLFAEEGFEPCCYLFGKGCSNWASAEPRICDSTIFFKWSKGRTSDTPTHPKPLGLQDPSFKFVICFNSLPASMRTANRSTAFFSAMSRRPVVASQKESLEKFKKAKVFVFEPKYVLTELKTINATLVWGVRNETLSVNVFSKVLVLFIGLSVAPKFSLKLSSKEESCYWKSREDKIEFEKITPETDAVKTTSSFSLSGTENSTKNVQKIKSEKNSLNEMVRNDPEDNVAVIKEIADECAIKQFDPDDFDDSCSSSNSKLLQWCSVSEPFQTVNDCGFRNTESRRDDGKTRVQDLLVRTYNLQRKLQQHLHKMTDGQASTDNVPPKASLPDLCVLYESNMNSEIVSFGVDPKPIESKPANSKSMQTEDCLFQSRGQSRSHSDVIKHVAVSQSTPKMNAKSIVEQDVEDNDDGDGDDGDEDDDARNETSATDAVENVPEKCLSSCSFKSSNDFFEFNEKSSERGKRCTQVQEESFEPFQNVKFSRKIFSDLEVFHRSLKGYKQKLLDDNKELRKNRKSENVSANDLEKCVAGDAVNFIRESTSSKVLRTIFKGKESSTELAIGLRDVSTTNISVEKTKFSPNHTKISINISKDQSLIEKEKSIAFSNENSKTRECQQEIKELLPLGLETLRTKKSVAEENESTDEEDEEDDDDFKSVASTLSRDSLTAKVDDKTLFKDTKSFFEGCQPSKRSEPFRKHQFNFYRKMSTDFNAKASERLLSRYDVKDAIFRELEPLRKALTDMQIRMRTIKRNSLLTSDEYYNRHFKFSKAYASYCQNCGSRTIVPEDAFGYHKSVLPRRYSTHQLKYCLNRSGETNSSFYSFHSTTELGDLDVAPSSTYLLNSPFKAAVHY